MKKVKVIRVDPYRRTLAAMILRGGRDCTPQLRQMIRAKEIGSRQIMAIAPLGGVGSESLMSVGGLAVDEAMPGWRLRGTDDTGGVGILTGRDQEHGFIIDVPVSIDWVRERIVWLDGEDLDGLAERAGDLLPSINDEVRAALSRAVPAPDGDMWLTAADKAVVGEAMVSLNLGTERSGGQMLTRLGDRVRGLVDGGI